MERHSGVHGERVDGLDPNDLKYHVDFEVRVIIPNKNWNGRLQSDPPPPVS